MTNEIAANVPDTDQRVMPLASFLLAADLDLMCMHTSTVPEEDAVTIARTVIAYLDGIEVAPSETDEGERR